MREIKAVIFDLYGTLISVHTDEDSLARLWKPLSFFYAFHGARYAPKELRAAYRSAVAEEEARLSAGGKLAEICIETVFARLYRERGAEPTETLVRDTASMFRACSMCRIEPYPGARELLKELRAAGKRVCLLSNAQRAFTQAEIEMFGLDECFDELLLSSDWEVRKPDHAYFACLLSRLPFSADEIIMVGNSAHDDIRPARELGLHACFLNTDGDPSRPDCDLVCDGADYAALKKWLLG